MTSIILLALGVAFMTVIPVYIVANLILQHRRVRG